MFFLQQTTSNVILERIGDQLFSVVVLICVAYLLWKRQQKMEDKMNEYLKEDRDKMMSVISKNTEAFERLEDLLEKTKIS